MVFVTRSITLRERRDPKRNPWQRERRRERFTEQIRGGTPPVDGPGHDRLVRLDADAAALHVNLDALTLRIAWLSFHRDEIPGRQLGFDPLENAVPGRDATEQCAVGHVGDTLQPLQLE